MGKVKEFQRLLGDAFEVVTYEAAFGEPLEVVEDGETFDANARKKVEAVSLQLGELAVSDDSGLVVPALGGRPGVYSARYGGEGLTSIERCERLLTEMADISDRSAYFQCAMAVKTPQGDIACVEGRVMGTLSKELSGSHGFGYDPIFIPEGYTETFARLDPSIKQGMSHRARATQGVLELPAFLKV